MHDVPIYINVQTRYYVLILRNTDEGVEIHSKACENVSSPIMLVCRTNERKILAYMYMSNIGQALGLSSLVLFGKARG
jgi:hypothetical protein